MSETVIPKERMTPFQRWELPELGSPGRSQRAAQVEQELLMPTVAQWEQWQHQGHQEGYEAGYAAGLAQGAAQSAMLGQAMQNLQLQLQQLDQSVLQSLLDLALEVARQMVRQALVVQPELVLAVVQEAVGSLPHFNQSAHLLLHPEDALLVRQQLEELLSHAGWKILEDPRLARGECRVETAHSQIDASFAKRWQQIVARLGQSSDWIQS